jgi:glyoxylase-like metal-dependent hydrolase (beta-lactamase superfamily II)
MSAKSISVKDLQQLLENGKGVTILDVRTQEQREEWKIEGSLHKDAYQGLNNGDKNILNDTKLPDDKPVVTVCAKGRSSMIAAEILSEKGHEVYSLEGGMQAWNYAWNTAEIADAEVTVIQVRRVAKGCLSYLIGSGKEAVVIDAALDPQIYIDLATKQGWTIKYVMDTHIHADYVSRTKDLSKATNSIRFFSALANVDYNFTPLNDGDAIPFGSSELTAIHTPGHTPESTSYLINGKYLLTGDTLFTDGVGRPDLKADTEQGRKKAEQLFASLRKILALKGQDLTVLPAHASHAIAFDKKMIGSQLSRLRNSIELLQLEMPGFAEQILKRIPPTPTNYLQIAEINKTGNYEGFDIADLEAGANRCAVS